MAPEGHLSIFLGSPFSRMAQVLVREWRLPVTEAELPSFPPAEAFFAENPLGQVPVLAIGGERLFPTLIVLERLWRMGGSPEEAYRPDAERQFLATLLGGGDALVAATYQRWAGLGPVGPNHVGFDPGARNLARFVAVLDWADEGGRIREGVTLPGVALACLLAWSGARGGPATRTSARIAEIVADLGERESFRETRPQPWLPGEEH